MGRMILSTEFQQNRGATGISPRWYFSDVLYNYHGDGKIKFDIKTDYPHFCAIHNDIMVGDHYSDESTRAASQLRIAMRRWTERSIEGDVIVANINMDYRVMEGDGDYFKHTTMIKHGYTVFHFETESEMLLFRLRFAEYVSSVQIDHPTRHFGKRWN